MSGRDDRTPSTLGAQLDQARAQIGELQRRLQRLEEENLELTVTNRMLAEVSARDALTGLYNRWYVIDKMEAEINRSIRHGSPMALLMLDIDHFKSVNDTYGHTAGDQVLQFVARLLRESCRVYDIAGRYGGEEFCVLLPETALGSTPIVAERIRQRLEVSELSVGGSSVGVTASIGIAGLDAGAGESMLSPAALIERADRALYSAKHRGRNRVEMWDAHLREPRPIQPMHH
jgi:diguanylate cyclase (GGDEF)-like protein